MRRAGAIKNEKLVNEAGEPMTIEFLLDDPTFEDVALFYKPNLERLGIAVTITDGRFEPVSEPGASISISTSSPACSRRACRPETSSANTGDRLPPSAAAAATRSASRTRWSTRSSISSSSRPTAPNWSRRRKRSIACCCGTTTWCRSSIAPRISCRTGTASAIPTPIPPTTSAFPTLWWWDEEKAKKVAANK